MAKYLTVFIIFLLNFYCQAYSQDVSKGFLAVEAGVNIPVGNFASKDISNDKSGFARTRSLVSGSIGYPFTKSKFGWLFSMTGIRSGFDGNWLVDKYAASVPKVIVDTRPWKSVLLMPGIFYQLPLNDEVSVFYLKGMVGLSSATSYGYMVRGNDFSKIQLHEKNDVGLGYALGLDFQTEVWEGINFHSSCKYISANHNFKKVKISNSSTGESLTSFKQQFQSIAASVGVSFTIH